MRLGSLCGFNLARVDFARSSFWNLKQWAQMVSPGNRVGRWIGVISLGTVVVLLIAAETALEGKLDAPKMLIYWGVCILLTMVSIVVALSEARAVQRMAKKD
jgi:hypothetical protein